MTKTITVIIYPKFTDKDLVTMLQLRGNERETLSDGYVVSRDRHGDIEVEIEEPDYEVEA